MKNKVELKNGVTLEVGKKYIHPTWLKDEVYEVTAIGETIFVYKPKDCDYELTHEIDNNWLPYEEPKTEKWYEYLDERGLKDTYYAKIYTNGCIPDDSIVLRQWDSKEKMLEDLKK